MKKGKSKDKTKLIRFGWKHKSTPYVKFEQMTKPVIPDEVTERLDTTYPYTVEELITVALDKIRNEDNRGYFEGISLQLGTWDNEVLENFLIKDGKKVGAWYWLEIRKIRNRPGFHLLTTKTQKKLGENSTHHQDGIQNVPLTNSTSSKIGNHVQMKKSNPLKQKKIVLRQNQLLLSKVKIKKFVLHHHHHRYR